MTADDLKTIISIQSPVTALSPAGVPSVTWKSVTKKTWCNWKSMVGDDESSARKLSAVDRATVTIRYRSGITPGCCVYRSGDKRPYEIIGPVIDVDDRRTWLQFKVERQVAAV